MKNKLDVYVKSILGILNKLEKEENVLVKNFFTDLLHGEQIADLMSKYGKEVSEEVEDTKVLIQIISAVNDNSNLVFEDEVEEQPEVAEVAEVEITEPEIEEVVTESKTSEIDLSSMSAEEKEDLKAKLENEAEALQKNRATSKTSFGSVLLKKTMNPGAEIEGAPSMEEETPVDEAPIIEDNPDAPADTAEEEDLSAWGLEKE